MGWIIINLNHYLLNIWENEINIEYLKEIPFFNKVQKYIDGQEMVDVKRNNFIMVIFIIERLVIKNLLLNLE